MTVIGSKCCHLAVWMFEGEVTAFENILRGRLGKCWINVSCSTAFPHRMDDQRGVSMFQVLISRQTLLCCTWACVCLKKHLVVCWLFESPVAVSFMAIPLGWGERLSTPQVQRLLLHGPWLHRRKRDCTALFLTSSAGTSAMSLCPSDEEGLAHSLPPHMDGVLRRRRDRPSSSQRRGVLRRRRDRPSSSHTRGLPLGEFVLSPFLKRDLGLRVPSLRTAWSGWMLALQSRRHITRTCQKG